MHGEPSKEHPWSIALGFDEYVPGSKFRLNNRRKVMAASFNMLELGTTALRKDSTWLTPIAVRSSHMQRVKGGWGNMFRLFLHALLLGDRGFATSGAPIVLNGRQATRKYCRALNV